MDPFAILIFMTSLQSEDREQHEAARLEGANFLQIFMLLTLPHLGRAIAVVMLIQMIFHLGVFAEILISTKGGPGSASSTLTYEIYKRRWRASTTASQPPAACSPSSSPIWCPSSSSASSATTWLIRGERRHVIPSS